jgi:hypothetical protein
MSIFKDFKKFPPAVGTRIVAISPAYPKGDPMRVRVVKNIQAAGLLRYLEPRGESMGMAFSEAGAEVLFGLHKKPAAGRLRTIEDGREINLWLDKETIEAARKKGSGSISAGIRMAFSELRGIGILMNKGLL